MITDSQIQNFLNSYGTKIKPDEDSDYVELMMDDHVGISYGDGYYVQKNNILYSDKDEEILDYLETNYPY